MKIKIPFTTKSIETDPLTSGIIVMLGIYLFTAMVFLLAMKLGTLNFLLFVLTIFVVYSIRTSKIVNDSNDTEKDGE